MAVSLLMRSTIRFLEDEGIADATTRLTPESDLAPADEDLHAIEDNLKAVSDALTRFYFSHAELRVS